MTGYYPPPLPVPAGLRTARLELRMLSAADVDLDLEALEASRAGLLRRSGGRWPRLGFDWRDNLGDLVVHQIEHLQRLAFTYTVLQPDGKRCLGCLYLRPLGQDLAAFGAPAAAVAAADPRASSATFWLRPDALGLGLDRHLLTALRSWFACEWDFREVLLLTNDGEMRNRRLFEAAGLPLALAFGGRRGRRWRLYRA